MRIASRALTVAAAIAAVALARPAAAQVLYSETFDDGNAASRWTTSPSGNPNYVINYAFDYASAGIPAAPGGTSTTGLKMEVNTAGAAIGSLMAFPNAENFSGNHTLAFDIWFNVTGTTATTEFGIFGLNHTSTAAQTPTGVTPGVGPSPNGIDYAMTGDTGAGRDIRLYVAGVEVNGTAGGYARNNLLIQEEQAAPYNFAYQPYLTSTTPMPANQWLRVAVTAYSGTTLFQVNGQTWARRANTTGTGNIMLGYMDIFTSVAPATIFGLYDNVTVSVADAPATQLAWTPDGTTAGGSGNWSNLGTQWIGSGTVPTTWDWSLPAKFQGTAGTVTIPTQVTAGAGLEFLTDGYTVSSGTLILGSYDPASAVSFNTNAIAQVTVAAGATARIESYIRGTRGVTKLGDGTLVLANANAVSGTSVVQSGTLRLGNQSALAQSPVSVVPGGTLEIDPALGMIAPRLLLNGGTVSAAGATLTVDRDIGVKQFVVNSGQLAGSPALEVTLAGTMVMSGSAINTIDVSTLSVQETGTDGGRIDLGVGRINVAPGGITAEALVADIVAGRGDGSWTGTTGITSSKAASEVAASNLRAVGWIDDGAGALSVAYAAPGDTNIDWVVDILDVSNFVAAGKFGTGDPATWADGDFNYDGLVDIQDVSDFSATGLYGGPSYNAPAGSAVAAVPEPAAGAAAGAGLVAAAVLARRHSRRRAA